MGWPLAGCRLGIMASEAVGGGIEATMVWLGVGDPSGRVMALAAIVATCVHTADNRNMCGGADDGVLHARVVARCTSRACRQNSSMIKVRGNERDRRVAVATGIEGSGMGGRLWVCCRQGTCDNASELTIMTAHTLCDADGGIRVTELPSLETGHAGVADRAII